MAGVALLTLEWGTQVFYDELYLVVGLSLVGSRFVRFSHAVSILGWSRSTARAVRLALVGVRTVHVLNERFFGLVRATIAEVALLEVVSFDDPSDFGVDSVNAVDLALSPLNMDRVVSMLNLVT